MTKTFTRKKRLSGAMSIFLRSLILFILVFAFSGVDILAQEAKIRTLNRKIEAAEKQHQRHLARYQEGDSLYTAGTKITYQSAEEVERVKVEMDKKTQTYRNQKRALAKKARVATSEDLTQLQIYEREIDNQYRADLRSYDMYMRDVLRESDRASSAATKGRRYKKDAQKRLKATNKQIEQLKEELAKLSNSN